LPVLAGIAMLIGASAPAMAAQSPVYTVANVAVNEQGSDAVTAKRTAIMKASHHALRRLLMRLVAFKAHDRLPELSDAAVEGLLDGFTVREERFSSTRYIAELEFAFDPDKVRDLLNRFGLPYTSTRSPEVKLLPVMEGSKGGEAWRQAWQNQDLAHGLVPVALAGAQARGVLPERMSATSRAVESLRERLGARYFVLASARLDQSGGRLHVKLTGHDEIGGFAFSQTYRIYDGDVARAAESAARISLLAIQSRWRLTSLKSQGALEGPAPLEPVTFTAMFDSLKAWQDLRAAISGISGVQDVEIKSLFAGGAEVMLSFPGGVERFVKAADANGMSLNENRGEWILRRR
jgi:hypothetical protein